MNQITILLICFVSILVIISIPIILLTRKAHEIDKKEKEKKEILDELYERIKNKD